MTVLPSRRLAPANDISWAGVLWRVQLGVVPNTGGALAVREVFIDPVAPNAVTAEILALVHDAAVVASHWLRDSGPAGAMARRLERQHPSLIALALDAAAACDRDLAAATAACGAAPGFAGEPANDASPA